jgi:hypothetical protein
VYVVIRLTSRCWADSLFLAAMKHPGVKCYQYVACELYETISNMFLAAFWISLVHAFIAQYALQWIFARIVNQLDFPGILIPPTEGTLLRTSLSR